VRERVRDRYAAAARTIGARAAAGRADGVDVTDEQGRQVFGGALYGGERAIAGDAVDASLGCGVPTTTRVEFERALTAAGLREVEIRETHRAHERAGAAIIRARKPI
jgi:hypothetical protein